MRVILLTSIRVVVLDCTVPLVQDGRTFRQALEWEVTVVADILDQHSRALCLSGTKTPRNKRMNERVHVQRHHRVAEAAELVAVLVSGVHQRHVWSALSERFPKGWKSEQVRYPSLGKFHRQPFQGLEK